MKSFTLQPLITEKSMALTANGVYQFAAPTWVNKNQVAEYVAKHFNVTVNAVNAAKMPDRMVLFKRVRGVKPGIKKFSVYLKKGDTIAEFSMPIEETKDKKGVKNALADQKSDLKDAKETSRRSEPKTTSQITVRKSGDK